MTPGLWIVVYIDTESGELVPCYECGLYSSEKAAEAQRLERHLGGLPTKVLELALPIKAGFEIRSAEQWREEHRRADLLIASAKNPGRLIAAVYYEPAARDEAAMCAFWRFLAREMEAYGV